jgi:hypothetical protein
MKFETIQSASKLFLRTRVGFNAAPTLRGLVRHMEATMALNEVFVPDGCKCKWMRFAAFTLYRRVLMIVGDVIS